MATSKHTSKRTAVTVACLLVDDMSASLAFYVDVLPYAMDYAMDAAGGAVPVKDRSRRGDITFTCLKARGGAEVMLQLRPAMDDYLPAGAIAPPPTPGSGSHVILYVRGVDVDAAYAALPPSADVLKKPRTMPYGFRELALRDPANGYVVVLTKHVGSASS